MNTPVDWTHVGGNLRRLRKARGFSQAALAVRAGVAKPTIANIERGVCAAGTSIRIYGSLSRALCVPIWILLEPDLVAACPASVPGTNWDEVQRG
jgi:transcriptional regulator with XRE-family HTH domain